MRECIYCGRQLEKGEVCNCAMSVAKRREREAARKAEEPNSKKKSKANEKTHKKEEKARARQDERNAKERAREARKNARRANRMYGGFSNTAYKAQAKSSFGDVWRIFKAFLRSPIVTVMNPGQMSVSVIMIFVIIEGMIGGLSVYSVISGASRGPVRLLGNLMGFSGARGYNTVLGWIASAFSGAVGGIVVFLLCSGIFYFINKWIFKQLTPYWEFSKRFSLAAIPVSIIGAVGVILGFFSQTTFAVLMIVGLVGTVVLVYEILRSAWYSSSAAKTLYAMLGGIFVFLMIALYIVRISVL